MTDARTVFDVSRPLQPNPGLPKAFLGGAVATAEHAALLAEPRTVDLVRADTTPIPATEDREAYYDDRHIEYWISGYADFRKIVAYLRPAHGQARYLDFGGATGRVARHAAQAGDIETWLCDINTNYIAWIDQFFDRPIFAFQNRITPALPIEDGYFDLVSAFSVFTHLDQDEIVWLLELRRIVRPGGILYLTVLDENVWDRLKEPDWAWLLTSLARGKHDEMLAQLCRQPLERRLVLSYSSAEAYNVNTFLKRDYLRKKWGPLFRRIEFLDDHHNYQTVVVLERP